MVIVVTLTDIRIHLNSIMTLIGWFARLINNVDCADISCPLNFKMKSLFYYMHSKGRFAYGIMIGRQTYYIFAVFIVTTVILKFAD
jgi:hypothetical protein